MDESPDTKSLSVNEAAKELGLDTFTLLGLIQRGKVITERSASEIVVPEQELLGLKGEQC